MSKLIKFDKVDIKEKGSFSLEQIHDFFFLIFMCAASAHQAGEGIDFYLIRGAFIIYFAVVLYTVVKNTYWHINGYVMWYVLFIGYAYLTIWWAPNASAVGAYMGTFIQAFGVIVGLANRIKTNEDVLKILRYIIYSIYYLGIVLIIKTPLDDLGDQERMGGQVGLHSNEIGFRLAVAALFSLYFLLTYKKKKPLFIAGLVFCSILTVLTGTRQALAIIVLGFVLYASFGSLKASKYRLYRRILSLTLIGVFVCVLWWVIFNNEYLYSIMGSRLQSMLSGFFGSGEGDSSMIQRRFLRDTAWELFLMNPLFGYGLNCFTQYLKTTGFHHITYAHNNYLELLSTTGIIGFSVFYAMFLYLFIKLFQISKKYKFHHLKSIFLIFLIMLIIVSYWSVNFQNEFIYAILVLIYMFLRIEKESSKSKVGVG